MEPGLGGLIFPQALGVGYDTIGARLRGDAPRNLIVGILLVKPVVWAVSLGSGTSGGVLASLSTMGGALGGLEAMFLPHEGAGFWPVVSMGAILGGTMRSQLTGIVFAPELTRDVNMLLPLLLAVTIAHGFTMLTLRRSILTEKVARRGFHLSREYSVDPLEILFARDLHQMWQDGRTAGLLGGVARKDPVVAYANEPLHVLVYRMAKTGFMRLPVLESRETRKLAGMISLHDLLHARTRSLHEEHRRERVLRIRMPFRTRRSASVDRIA